MKLSDTVAESTTTGSVGAILDMSHARDHISCTTTPECPQQPGNEATSLRLRAALEYAARGWRVFPVHSPTGRADRPCSCGKLDCTNVGKHPRTARGFKDATTDEAQIREWWTMWPDANIGVATGIASGIWVLDVDGAEGQAALAQFEREHGPLPETVGQVTGSGGRHLLFRYVPGLTNKVKFAPGLDVRTDGGYVVVPPSLHVSGRRYEWEVTA
jgi:putative DNA primase/helicase